MPTQTTQHIQDSGQADLGEFDQNIGSILVADCGSSFTRLSLLERVEGGYCFVAHTAVPTTVEPPCSDISIGVRYATEQMAQVTGRSFLSDSGGLIIPETRGQGVDLFVVTSSAAQPLQVVLAGLVSQVSLASLERAAAGAYVKVLGFIARDYVGDPDRKRPATEHSDDEAWLSDEEKVAMIRQHHPDIVWVAGGTDGGSREPVLELVETIALACTLVDRSPRPSIVYAGNTELRSELVGLVGEEVELEVIDNVRPALEVENLAPAQSAFQAAYVERKLQRLPGIGSLIGWSSAPVLSTAQAMGYLTLYLQRLYESGKGALCADVGSSATTIAASFPQDKGQAGVLQSSLHVATDLGVGYAAPALLECVGVKAIARWLPFEPEAGEIEKVLLNKGVRPTTIPEDRRELLIEQAAAREALRMVMSRARRHWYYSVPRERWWLTPLLEPIIATGGILGQAPRPGQAVLMLLDAIEPVGVTTIALDPHGLAAALGAVAVAYPLAAVQALEAGLETLDTGAFLTLATVVAPVGRARPGEVVMRVKITFEQGGELEIEVKYGSLEVLPLRVGEKARLEFKPRRGFSVGRVKGTVEVSGGIVGLVIDARGRPLRLPSRPEICREQVQRWLWDMGA